VGLKRKRPAKPARKLVRMTIVHHSGTAAQVPPPTPNAVAGFNDAIHNARFVLLNGPLDCAKARLEKASRLAAEVKNPYARELANLASALSPAFETVKLVQMYLDDMFPEH
jgi:hypothetical protein